MPMVPFFTKFTRQAVEETRSVTVSRYRDLPPGAYGFLEFYCDEPDCDCRRVILRVVKKDAGEKIWATITFGWELPEFYRRWLPDSPPGLEQSGASLELMGTQSTHAPGLLALFKEMVRGDAAYVERLKQHYAQLKQAVGAKRDEGRRAVAPPAPKRKSPGRYAWLMEAT